MITKRKQKRYGKKGFTLVETVAVVAIIGILLGLAFPALDAVQQSAMDTAAKANLRSIETVLYTTYWGYSNTDVHMLQIPLTPALESGWKPTENERRIYDETRAALDATLEGHYLVFVQNYDTSDPDLMNRGLSIYYFPAKNDTSSYYFRQNGKTAYYQNGTLVREVT